MGEPGVRVFAGRGGISDLAWSPDGRWLLIARPAADEWVLVRQDAGHIKAVANVSSQFRSPNRFPRIEGWSCSG